MILNERIRMTQIYNICSILKNFEPMCKILFNGCLKFVQRLKLHDVTFDLMEQTLIYMSSNPFTDSGKFKTEFQSAK